MATRRGRPRKFTVPARPVTLTLPEHVIEALSAVDPDLSRAIVRLTQPELGKQAHLPAELATFGRRAVIVVNPTRALEQRTGISLVHLPDGRALISFAQARTIAELELTLHDGLEDASLPPDDRQVFEAIVHILKDARHSHEVLLHRRNIIVLESTLRRRRAAKRQA